MRNIRNGLALHHSLFEIALFSLLRAEVVVPVEVIVPFARLAPASKLKDPHDRILMWRHSRREGRCKKQVVVLSKQILKSL